MRAKFPGLLWAAQLSGGGGAEAAFPHAPHFCKHIPCGVGVRVCPGVRHCASLPLSPFALTLLSPWVKSGGSHSPERDPLWHRLSLALTVKLLTRFGDDLVLPPRGDSSTGMCPRPGSGEWAAPRQQAGMGPPLVGAGVEARGVSQTHNPARSV